MLSYCWLLLMDWIQQVRWPALQSGYAFKVAGCSGWVEIYK